MTTVRRYTTNSRGPGQYGMPVTTNPGKLARCVKCGGMRFASSHPHAPHFDANGRGLVDCVGDVLEPNPNYPPPMRDPAEGVRPGVAVRAAGGPRGDSHRNTVRSA